MSRGYVASAGLAFLLATVAFAAGGGTELGRTTAAEILMVAAGAGLVAAAVVSRKRGPVPGTLALVAFGALVVFTALSIGWSVVPDLSFVEAGRSFAYLAVFAGAIAAARLAPTASPVLLRSILGAIAALCLYAAASRVWPSTLDPHAYYSRVGQPFGYWNAVGGIAAMGIVPALWMGARRSSAMLERALAFPACGLCVLMLLLTQSRGALAAAVIGAIVWFIFVPLRLRSLAVLAVGAVGAAPLAAWGLSQAPFTEDGTPVAARDAIGGEFGLLLVLTLVVLLVAGLGVSYGMRSVVPSMRVRRRVGIVVLAAALALPLALFTSVAFSSRGLTGTISAQVNDLTSENAGSPPGGPARLGAASSSRPRYWHEAFDVFGSRPGKGSGAGTFYISRLRYRKDELVAQHAHGYVPQTMSDLGIVGLVLSLLALVTWVACALRATALVPRLRKRQEPREPVEWTGERTALLGLVTVALVFGIQSAVDWTWFVPGVTGIALAAAGFVGGRGAFTAAAAGSTAALGPEPTGEGRLRRPPWPRLLGAVAVLATAALLATAIWQPQRSSQASADALSQMDRGDLKDAADKAKTAASADPLARQPRFALASVASASGRVRVARRILEDTIKDFPGDPQTWLHLAEFELHHDQPLRALEVVRGALYLDPFNKAARLVREQARAAALAKVGKGHSIESQRRRELLERQGVLPGGTPGAPGPGGAAAQAAAGGAKGSGGGNPLTGAAQGHTKVPSTGGDDNIDEYR